MTDAQQLTKYIADDLLSPTDEPSGQFLARCKNIGFSFIDGMVEEIEEAYDEKRGHEVIAYLKTEGNDYHVLSLETCEGCGARADGFHHPNCPELPVDERRTERII